ncbi:AbrB/MazE/SpoVT family DNA-binding domain-containing protein [Paenibacillus alkaliterrae]|uniref:AbrB/MazE/SpoVT family DNA-binding domain-containing protein n=1 Tax=Paenibacillus alkaliterrae TaxID=320909 RepID=UPI001F17BB6D|nr:AbrB/MazE/SpoVT family DNA-binding domain-containing protein [Paenibacillus alkaliterrae]MCF2937981.1 AbrB/MazE/SpoVT family DNA-binding domain-containing protein [Paenibacillus alkaliterrae]
MFQSTSKISSKGQVVVPIEIRKQFQIVEGDSLKFIIDDSGELKVEVLKRNSIMDLFGSVQAKGDTKDFSKVRQDAWDKRVQQITDKMEDE